MVQHCDFSTCDSSDSRKGAAVTEKLTQAVVLHQSEYCITLEVVRSVNLPPNLGVALTCRIKSFESIFKCFNNETNVVLPLSPAMIGGCLGFSITVTCALGQLRLTNRAVNHPAVPPPNTTTLEFEFNCRSSGL